MGNFATRATVIGALGLATTVPVTSALAATGAPAVRTAATTTSTAAPPSSASAVAAEIQGVLTVGGTSSKAGATGSEAHADALDLLGTRVAGGDASNGKSASGNLVGTGDTPLGDLEVAPWSASSSGSATAGWKSVADAALLHLNLADVAEAYVLHSQSQSAWNSDQSTGDSSSDGAEVALAGLLDVKVLHAEAHSGEKGTSDLLVVNGTEIGSSDQANGACALDASPLLDLVCLTADGGSGANGTTTSGGTVATVTGVLPGTTAVGTRTTGGVLQAAPTTPRVHSSSPGSGSGPLPNTNGPASGSLPFTGSPIVPLTLAGAAIAAVGAAFLSVARRRPRLGFRPV